MLTKQIKMINDRLMFVSVWFITGFKVCFFNEPFPNVILFMNDKVMFLSVGKVVLYRQVFASFLISVESLSKEVTRNQGRWWKRWRWWWLTRKVTMKMMIISPFPLLDLSLWCQLLSWKFPKADKTDLLQNSAATEKI